MDWFLDSADRTAFQELRSRMRAYLQRHAVRGSDVEAGVLAFTEMVTNAVVHAGGPVWISVLWTDEQPVLTVQDLGPGFELAGVPRPPGPDVPGGRGLFIVSHLTEALDVARKRAGGSRVSTTLPVRREVGSTSPAVRRTPDSLPALEEADEEGAFDRESFLRALVVQLARAVEADHGPEAAARAIAQVGADVGGRMEEAYRLVERVTGPLSEERIADLYVRLKHAIDGDFYVQEISEDRIVLGNRRCPFGDAVQRAPALCRMTSSVFGGIAARNRGAAGVQLEERIAVGDPGCRVVVWLRDPPAEAGMAVHRYTQPTAEPAVLRSDRG